MSLTTTAVQVNGNSSVITANTTSGNTQLVINTVNGSLPGAFYVVNSSANIVFVNFDYTGTANAVVATGDQNGRGISVGTIPVVVNLNQGWQYNPGPVYVTAVATTGTANVYFTPVA